MHALNQVDLAFIVDTTGSMGGFISAAREQMTEMLRSLTSNAALPIDLQVGVVEYRDHPPQDTSFVTREYDFTGDLKQVQTTIAKLEPGGGGDAPEAVYDGVESAAVLLSWRRHSRQIAVLVGDAPPHGGQAPHATCTACGLSAERVTASLEGRGIVLYALGLTGSTATSFGWLASYTGGQYFDASRGAGEAIQALSKLLIAEFSDLGFDKRVLEQCQTNPLWSVDRLGEALESPRGRISASLSRLGRRHLLPQATSAER